MGASPSSTLLTIALASAGISAQKGPGPNAWAVTSNVDANVTKKWDNVFEYLEETAEGRGCLLVIENGQIVYEKYNEEMNYNKDTVTYGFSATKTLGALIVGAVHNDFYSNLSAQEFVSKLTTEFGVESPRDYDVSIEDILTQRLANDQQAGTFAYDFAGNRWINDLPKIVAKILEDNNSDPKAFWDGIKTKLGLSDGFYWGPEGLGVGVDNNYGFGAAGTCRDWARFGQLFQNEGKWLDNSNNNIDIMKNDYFTNMVNKSDANSCYGYLTYLGYENVTQNVDQCYVPTEQNVGESQSTYPPAVDDDINFIVGALGQIVMQFPSAPNGRSVISMGRTLPVGFKYPHHIASRVAEASTCFNENGWQKANCNDFDPKTREDVTGNTTLDSATTAQIIRGQLDIYTAGVFNGTLYIPETVIQSVIQSGLESPEKITDLFNCLPECNELNYTCTDACLRDSDFPRSFVPAATQTALVNFLNQNLQSSPGTIQTFPVETLARVEDILLDETLSNEEIKTKIQDEEDLKNSGLQISSSDDDITTLTSTVRTQAAVRIDRPTSCPVIDPTNNAAISSAISVVTLCATAVFSFLL